jgi:polysaccharide pyruvyl transferase WcaK-like protein
MLSATASDAVGGPRRRRVCILGASLDVGNRGVLALGVSVARLVMRASGPVDLAFHYSHSTGGSRRLTGFPEDVRIEVYNCRMSPRSAPAEHILVILTLALLYRIGIRGFANRNPWLRSLLHADFVGDIRGGDSFSDIYGFRRFVVGSLPLVTVAILGRPYAMLPQTYGPFRGRVSRWLARRLLRRAQTIITRDQNCSATVERLCGKRPRFCPDVAFTLEAREPDEARVTPNGLDLRRDSSMVGLNVSGLLYMGGYTGQNMFGLRDEYNQLIDQVVEHVLRTTEATLLLIPHEFGEEGELEACAAILESTRRRYPGRVFMLTSVLDERELKWVIGRTRLFMGSRMHACIAALSQGIPAIGLAYSDKFLGVFQSVGLADAVIDLRTEDAAATIARVRAALESRATFSEQLRVRIPTVQRAVVRSFEKILA